MPLGGNARERSSQELLKGRGQAVEVLAGVLLGDAQERASRQIRKVGFERNPAEDPAFQEQSVDLRHTPPCLREVDDELLEGDSRQAPRTDAGDSLEARGQVCGP